MFTSFKLTEAANLFSFWSLKYQLVTSIGSASILIWTFSVAFWSVQTYSSVNHRFLSLINPVFSLINLVFFGVKFSLKNNTFVSN